MTNREAINILRVINPPRESKRVFDKFIQARDMAIKALEKQEQVNTQSVNLTHTTYPNALESLKILESAKDENGCVPMSLVRLAFRNVLEQDRWIPVTERLPEKDCSCRVTEDNGYSKYVIDCYWSNRKKRFEVWSDYNDCYIPLVDVTAWKLQEEPYTEEEA